MTQTVCPECEKARQRKPMEVDLVQASIGRTQHSVDKIQVGISRLPSEVTDPETAIHLFYEHQLPRLRQRLRKGPSLRERMKHLLRRER